MEDNWVGKWSDDVLHHLRMWTFNDSELTEKSHTQMWVWKGWAGGVDISHYISVGLKVCNIDGELLTLQLYCRWTNFQHRYHNIAGNSATVGLTEVVVILMPADFCGEWNVTTLILWIFAFHPIQAKWKGSLPAVSMQGNLQSGLLQSSFPCPTSVKEISPCSSDSILTGVCGAWSSVWSSPSALQLAGEACQWRSRADNCICNILNQTSLTATAIIYYYRASMRERPLHWGSRQYYTVQNTPPHTGFSPHLTQQ